MEVSCNRFDLIIIGGGIMGSCTAYEAAKRGLNVLLLEQFDFLHHLGSSHGESRTIRCTYAEHYYIPMVLESFRLWEEAQSEIGYRVLTETTHFIMGPTGDKNLQSIIANSISADLEADVLNYSQVMDKLHGTFRLPQDWIGVTTKKGGVIKATKAVAMFQALAIKKGAVLKDHMEVVDIKREDEERGGVMVTTSSKHQFRANKCVVTAGAWTRKLVETVSGLSLPIQPLHPVICYWKIKEGSKELLSLSGGFPTFSSYGKSCIYGTPSVEFPGLIKIVLDGGHCCDPDQRDWGSIEGVNTGPLIEPVRRWIEEVMPGHVESDGPVLTQPCMYSMTPDEDFVIDYVGGDFGKDVVVAGGFSGHGFKMGPVIGRILVQMAVDGAEGTGVEIEWFRMGRFGDNPAGSVKDYEDQVSSRTNS